VNPCRRSGQSIPATVAAVTVATNTAYLPSLRVGEESSKRGNGDFKHVVRGWGRNGGAISARGDEIPPPLFRLCAGARAISMFAAARAGVDHFWLTGARDEGGSRDTTDSSLRPGPGQTVL
jgi:hypothetical protein